MVDTLKLDNLACERDDRHLFSGLSYEIRSGDVIQVLGENGAGKTTLLKMLAGLTNFHTGQILWNNKTVRLLEFYASMLYLGHESGVNALLTPYENLRWFMGLHGNKSSKKDNSNKPLTDTALYESLAKVDLVGFEQTPCSQLSAGQKRRVALARLYLTCAPIWILDEPFTALDKQGVQALEALFKSHTAGGGIVIITSHQAININNVKPLNVSDYVHSNNPVNAHG